MRIGVDFDNTIVSYDGVFHKVAVERGLIGQDVSTNKDSVRDYLRSVGKENDWIELQGHVYGARMDVARPYKGVIEFFRRCVRNNVDVFIVSHKTRRPFAGEPHDLHAAAKGWLTEVGFFDPGVIGLDPDRVFFELTKQEKIKRIVQLGCTHFIDDLPEFLAEPGFSADTRRVLFDPTDAHLHHVPRVGSWREFTAVVFGEADAA